MSVRRCNDEVPRPVRHLLCVVQESSIFDVRITVDDVVVEASAAKGLPEGDPWERQHPFRVGGKEKDLRVGEGLLNVLVTSA